MRYSFNILHVIIVLYVGSINGSNRRYSGMDYDNTAPLDVANNDDHNIEESGLIKSDNPFGTDSLNSNPNLEQDLKVNNADNAKMEQLTRVESNLSSSLVNKSMNKKSNSVKCNKRYKESINKFTNKHNRLFNDVVKDNNVIEDKAAADFAKDCNANTIGDNSNMYLLNRLLNFPHSQSIMKNNDAIFDKFYSDLNEDVVLKQNGIRQRIKNRQPVFNGKLDQLKSVNELELKLNDPLHDNNLINNVLNTQSFITYLRKTLGNSTLKYKSYNNGYNKHSNDDASRYIYKRYVSAPLAEKNHKKKKKANKFSVESSVTKNQYSTTKKLHDVDDDYALDSVSAVNAPQKKIKATNTGNVKDTNAVCETVSACTTVCKTTEECTTTCEPSTTTCEPSTTTCEPSTTTCEPSTTCQVTTACEELTPERKQTTSCDEPACDFCSDQTKKPKKRKTCPTKSVSCTPQTPCETEETECDEETTKCSTTPKCKTTEQCDDAEIINGDDNTDELITDTVN